MAENQSGARGEAVASSSVQWLRRAVTAAVKTFLLSAVALAGLYFTHPDETRLSIKRLRSFTPATMLELVQDAMNQCVPGLDAPPPDLSEKPRPKTLTLSKDLGPPECRVKLKKPEEDSQKKGEEELPALGHWVARLDQLSVPHLPLITPMIAMADVGVHLTLASSVPMKFLALTQLLFGFAVTAAILRLLYGRLNEFWFAFLLFFGTLMIGSGIGWLLLILVGQILGGVESVVRLPALKFILASACTLTGMGFFTRQLLEWSRDKAKDKATDSLADKAADWLLRYII
jgi:hypothetical protein